MAKKRANGEGNIRKRKDGRWEGRYTAGHDANGKAIYKNVLGKTQAEVKEKLKRAIEENKGLDIVKAGQYTLGQWMDVWFENYAKLKVRPSSHQTYKGYINNHIKPHVGSMPLSKLTSLDLQKLYKMLLAKGRIDRIEAKNRPKGLSAKTVRNISQIISSALNLSKEQKLISSNPAEACALPKVEHREMKTLPVEQLTSFLREARETGVYEMYYIELATGLRRGELLGLKWDDIDMNNGTIRVQRQVTRIDGEIVEAPLKTKNSYRTVSIGDDAIEVLKEQRKKVGREIEYVFPSPNGGPISPDSVLNMLHRVLERAGLPKIRFHDLRHTFATLALQNGVDIKTVSGMLGHFSAGFTLDTSEYWDRVNRATFFGRLMRNASETNYQETLREVGHRAGSAVEEIYDDLQNHIKSVRAISSDRRSSLAKQVQGLYDVCSMAGAFCSHSSDCIGILNLSSFYLPSTSFGDDREIQNAIHKIKNCPDFFASECIDLVRQAADWSISFAAGSDARKSAFLKDVSQGNGREFLRDVLNAYHSSNEMVDLRGNCGYSIGSREYRNYMERKVFLQDLPAMSSDDYDGALRDSLTYIASQLQRDLARNERENNYITDETARKLRDAASELGRCGVSVGFADSSIDRLNWFVGGDPDKIRRLQSKLNQLGVGQHLEEDGVYGEKTKEAVDDAIEKVSDFLADPNKMRLLDQTVDAIASALDFTGGPQSQIRKMHDALEKSRRELQRIIWKLGAEYYLRPRGYDVAALLLEHSIESSPSNLHFSQSHWVTQKIMQSNGFRQFYRNLENQIQQSPSESTMTGSELIVFGNSDTDLYLGFGTCTAYYTCRRNLSSVEIDFTVYDEYDFDKIRSISGDVEHLIKSDFRIGNLANDAGLFSQADAVISKYEVFAKFQKTIPMKGVYL